MNDSTVPSWPPPTSWVREHLAASDQSMFDERVERYAWLAERFDLSASELIWGGVPAWFTLGDARWSYLAGNFVAVVLCAHAFAEHCLGTHYTMMGDDKSAEEGLARLIDRSFKEERIDQEFAERLHRLRKMRNRYIHPTSIGKSKSYMTRLIAEGYSGPHDMAEADAKFAIDVIAEFIAKEPAK